MQELSLSIGEPFTSPAWGSNFVVFSGENGAAIPEAEAKAYLNRVCRYAKHYEVYLVPERFVLMGYQCLCLISPSGKVLGAQRAIHLNTSIRVGTKRSSEVEVFQTEFGGVFLCVDVDIYHPQVCRIASDMGAQYMIAVQQMTRNDYSTDMVITGVWNVAQSNNAYVVAVSNQYHCVCGPLQLTESGDGFVARPTLKTPLTRMLNAKHLASCPRRRPLSRKLYAVHRGELIG